MAAAVLVIAGCGTGSDSGTTTTTTTEPGITLTEWRQETAAVCEEFEPQVSVINEAQGPTETNDDLVALIEAVEPLAVRYRAALMAVEVPDERAEDVERTYELYPLLADDVAAVVAAASNDDEAALDAASEALNTHDAEKRALLTDLGVTACVQ